MRLRFNAISTFTPFAALARLIGPRNGASRSFDPLLAVAAFAAVIGGCSNEVTVPCQTQEVKEGHGLVLGKPDPNRPFLLSGVPATVPLANGGLVLAGSTSGPDGNAADTGFFVDAHDANGNKINLFGSAQHFGNPDVVNQVSAASKDHNGNIFVCGTVSPSLTKGDIFCSAYTDKGVPNTTIGAFGTFLADFGHADSGQAMVMTPDDKLIVGGNVACSLLSGSPDDTCLGLTAFHSAPFSGGPFTAYGSNGTGRVTTSLGVNVNISSMTVGKDESVIVAGSKEPGTPDEKGFLVRYLKDGTRDKSFGKNEGVDGVVSLKSILAGSYRFNIVAHGEADELIVGGVQCLLGCNMIMARFHPDGTIDSNFNGGIVEIAVTSNADGISYNSQATSLALDKDTIVVTGTASQEPGSPSEGKVVVAIIKNDGGFSTDFGGIGYKLFELGSLAMSGSINVQTSGFIISGALSQGPYFLFKVNKEDGCVDNTYGKALK